MDHQPDRQSSSGTDLWKGGTGSADPLVFPERVDRHRACYRKAAAETRAQKPRDSPGSADWRSYPMTPKACTQSPALPKREPIPWKCSGLKGLQSRARDPALAAHVLGGALLPLCISLPPELPFRRKHYWARRDIRELPREPAGHGGAMLCVTQAVTCFPQEATALSHPAVFGESVV